MPQSAVYRKGPVELRLGDWREVLADIELDSLITDPPYSERTAKGQRSGRTSEWIGSSGHSHIDYGFVTEENVHELVTTFAPLIDRWLVMFGDHISVSWALDAAITEGLYDFAPIQWVKPDAAPRVLAEGPSPGSEHIAVARTRKAFRPGERRFRRGYYAGPSRNRGVVVGGKPTWLMRALVRDYSRPGDIVCDPYAGGATTLIAAALEGRRAIGAELDPETFGKACARIERTALTAPLPGIEVPRMKQEGMDL